MMVGAGLLAWFAVGACKNKSERWWREDADDASAATDEDDFIFEEDEASTRPAATPTPRPTPPGHTIYVAHNQLFVEGTVITAQEVLADVLPELRKRATKLPRAQLRDRLAARIRNLVIEILIYREAREETNVDDAQGQDGVSPLEKAAQIELERIINNVAQGSQARYEQYLVEIRTDIEARKEAIKRRMLVERYLHDKLLPAVNIRRRDLFQRYEDNKDKYQNPRTVELFMIEVWLTRFLPEGVVVKKDGSGPTKEQWASARAQADAQVERIMSELTDHGIPFDRVCRQYSNAPNAVRGGAWDKIGTPIAGRDGEMLPATESALKMGAHELGEPIRSPSGRKIFIVKTGEITPAAHISFRDAQSEIRKELENEQFRTLAERYEDKLWKKATIPPLTPFLRACVLAAPKRWGGGGP